MSRERATEALWTGLRLVVVDVETTSGREQGTRIVSIGTVTCRGGRVQGQWSTTLTPAPGETLVLAAHNDAFDIPVVRDEMATAGHGQGRLDEHQQSPRLPLARSTRPPAGQAAGAQVSARRRVSVTSRPRSGAPLQEPTRRSGESAQEGEREV